jgi:hypothetical protein
MDAFDIAQLFGNDFLKICFFLSLKSWSQPSMFAGVCKYICNDSHNKVY